MLAANNLRAILDAAEQAAAREDLPSAERLLREALALQESTPGSPREEIARTLNNLAVVCEMTGKLKDAESCYRRAYANATASLPASDPFVTTSRENLEAFCRAQGLPLAPQPAPAPPHAASPPPVSPERRGGSSDPPTPPPNGAPQPSTPKPAPPLEPTPAPRAPSPAPHPPRMPSAVPAGTPRGPSRAIVVGVLFLSAIAIGIVIARNWVAPSVADRAATISPSDPVTSAPAPASVPEPAAPAPAPAPPEPTPQTQTPPAQTPGPEPVAAAPAPIASAPEPPPTTALTVVSAQLCRSLTRTGEWQCESASGTQEPGTMYFYTRVASPRDTVVEHRWYRDGSLHQRVELRIGANQNGFRTYSRNTISADRAGAWRVELRSEDGRVLHEETFAVR